MLTFHVLDDPIHIPGGPRIYRSPQFVIEDPTDFDLSEEVGAKNHKGDPCDLNQGNEKLEKNFLS